MHILTENYRALIVILGLAIPTFWYLYKPVTASLVAPADYRLRAVLWLVLTAVLFVAQNFWIFVFVTALLLLTAGRKDTNPLGLYFFLLLVAPPFQSAIQGFGGINYFLSVDYLRLLSLVILLPTAVVLATKPGTPGVLKMPTDKYLLAYIALLLVIQAPLTSTTDLMRSMVSDVIDILLPYYVFSRGISSMKRLRDTLASFTVSGAVFALIGVFEFFKGWLLYSSLPNFLDVHWAYGNYMLREGGLRATGSAGHSIVFGYLMTVAFGLHLALRPYHRSTHLWQAMLLLLAAGIGSSVSRGPWVGAAALVAVAVAIGPGAAQRVGKAAVAAIIVIPGLLVTSFGAKIIALLPFVGTVAADTVDYRQQLFEVSWQVLMQNPWFGSPYYMATAAMQQLRQGEGIIDMVNSYLGVAMISGFVGLALFAGVFASCVVGLGVHLAQHRTKTGDDFTMARGLLATLVGVLVIIATASSINAIPVVYWCLAGTCAAYLRLAAAERFETAAQTTVPIGGVGRMHRYGK
jgi:hypothetical protein